MSAPPHLHHLTPPPAVTTKLKPIITFPIKYRPLGATLPPPLLLLPAPCAPRPHPTPSPHLPIYPQRYTRDALSSSANSSEVPGSTWFPYSTPSNHVPSPSLSNESDESFSSYPSLNLPSTSSTSSSPSLSSARRLQRPHTRTVRSYYEPSRRLRHARIGPRRSRDRERFQRFEDARTAATATATGYIGRAVTGSKKKAR